MEEEAPNKQEKCKGCQDLEQAIALSHRMGEAASEYLSILEDIASEVQGLITEMPGDVFKPVPEILLPKGLNNNIQDPREVIKQLRDLCRTGFTTAEVQYEELEKEKENLQSDLETKTKKIEDLQKDLEIETKKNEDLQRDLDERSRKMEDLQKDLETTTKKNEDLQRDLETEAKKREDLKREKETDMASHEQEVGKLTREIQEMEDKNNQLCRNVEEKANQVQKLKVEAESLHERGEEYEEEIKQLKGEVDQTKNNLDTAHVKIQALEKTVEEQKETIRDLSNRNTHVSHWITNHVQLSCVIPQSAHEDDRINPIMSEFMQHVNSQMDGCTVNVINKPGPDIDLSVGLPVILPCIAASRVASNISAALTKANVASGQVILVIFHHLAPYNSKINTPTEQRLSDRTLLDQCVGMVDAVFWNGAMYDCAANHAAVRSIQQLFRWSLSMESLKKLKHLAN